MTDAPASTTVRSFIAVPLPEEVRARILSMPAGLSDALPNVRWQSKIENLHITLKFLGDVTEETLGALATALQDELDSITKFGIRVRGLGAFPSESKANIFWVGIDDPSGGLEVVAEIAEATAERFGFARENRPWRPHITIGRNGRGVDARRALRGLADETLGSTTVDEIHVYESQLGGGPENKGSTYVLRSRARLGGAAGSN
jgi:RNA 2',3'-cyclic 3'-phosphodiesterase